MMEREKMLDKKSMTLNLEKMTKKLISKHQISSDELSRKRSLQERGITLIALVVTIIILLILAGVTLNIALSDNGLFSKTQEAAEKYKQAQSDEEEMVRQIATQMYSEYVGVEVTGYNPTSTTEGCTVGTDNTGYETAQILYTDESMRWRIWDFDGNTLRIIGDPTDEKIYFQGAAGYNNGVWTMEHICKELYSNDKKGVSVTNLKRSDIQKVSTYDYTNYKHQKDNYEDDTSDDDVNTIHYGETEGYENVYYPEMWEKNDKKWTYKYENKNITGTDKEAKIWEITGNDEGQMENEMLKDDSKVTFKQSYYWHNYKKNEFINNKYYDLIFYKTDGNLTYRYWLGGRTAGLESNICYFSLMDVDSASDYKCVHAQVVCSTEGKTDKYEGSLRPIVTINLNESKCTMTPEKGTDGSIKYKLSFAE